MEKFESFEPSGESAGLTMLFAPTEEALAIARDMLTEIDRAIGSLVQVSDRVVELDGTDLDAETRKMLYAVERGAWQTIATYRGMRDTLSGWLRWIDDSAFLDNRTEWSAA